MSKVRMYPLFGHTLTSLYPHFIYSLTGHSNLRSTGQRPQGGPALSRRENGRSSMSGGGGCGMMSQKSISFLRNQSRSISHSCRNRARRCPAESDFRQFSYHSRIKQKTFTGMLGGKEEEEEEEMTAMMSSFS